MVIKIQILQQQIKIRIKEVQVIQPLLQIQLLIVPQNHRLVHRLLVFNQLLRIQQYRLLIQQVPITEELVLIIKITVREQITIQIQQIEILKRYLKHQKP